MHALDGRDLRHAARLKPVEEFDGRAGIGAARVRIPDLRHEEFKEAWDARSLAAVTAAGMRSMRTGASWFILSESAKAAPIETLPPSTAIQ